MALSSNAKKELTKKFGANEKDTGNASVQVAILSTRIAELTEHLKKNKKDFGCQRGLQMMVGKRRRLLDYLKSSSSADKYKKLLNDLGLRK
ncbi:MAG: 30S ribosomal protein S15 [Vampirovibrionales bacterium]|nr:30S ribosomal protein S15 [Vampirovibrionales bacterium]